MLTCDADAVVVGEVKSKWLNSPKIKTSFLQTKNYRLKRSLKITTSDPIVPNTEITVSNPGAKIQLNNRIVEAKDLSFPAFGRWRAIPAALQNLRLSQEATQRLTRKAVSD